MTRAAAARAEERELARFVAGETDAATLHHADKLRLAYLLLARHPFEEALARFAAALRTISARAGHPEKYHVTVTVAFFALVAERLAAGPDAGWEAFRDANPDLLRRDVLGRWYASAELHSARARGTFVLPAPAGA